MGAEWQHGYVSWWRGNSEKEVEEIRLFILIRRQSFAAQFWRHGDNRPYEAPHPIHWTDDRQKQLATLPMPSQHGICQDSRFSIPCNSRQNLLLRSLNAQIRTSPDSSIPHLMTLRMTGPKWQRRMLEDTQYRGNEIIGTIGAIWQCHTSDLFIL